LNSTNYKQSNNNGPIFNFEKENIAQVNERKCINLSQYAIQKENSNSKNDQRKGRENITIQNIKENIQNLNQMLKLYRGKLLTYKNKDVNIADQNNNDKVEKENESKERLKEQLEYLK